MTSLGESARGRDNNLNLIRMVAALAVLVSHAYPISQGPDAIEPLQALTGRSLGSHAVAIFFVISGFLIAESYARAPSWQDFLIARVLRLWPGLLASLALVAFVMGPVVTGLPISAYLTSGETWTFMFDNILLFDPAYTLPGVFTDLPYSSVEGSIWTLFYEVVCYGGLFFAGIFGILSRNWTMSALIAVFVLLLIAVEVIDPALPTKAKNMLTLALPFAVGTGLWLWKDQLPLTIWGALLLLIVTVLLSKTPLYWPALTLFVAYATFWLAYVPAGIWRQYNRIGDYSYGVYIYAFPMQGLAVWLAGPMDPLTNMLLALPLTLIPSMLSWHLIEKPALRQRRRFSARFNRVERPIA